MITTISLSPAIDKRLEFETFSIGGTNRVVRSEAEGAGKAVNVALAAQALGLPAHCAGILPGSGQLITERLERFGVAYDFLPAPGSVRVNQKLFDRSAQVLIFIVCLIWAALLALIFALGATFAWYCVLVAALVIFALTVWFTIKLM